MPSSCPKCHAVLEEDEICCAQVRYSWRCKSCFKLTTGFAIPYGKCFLCGGALEVIPGRNLGDSMRFRAIRDAVQFELDSFHFYKLARDRPAPPNNGPCWKVSTKPSWTICTSSKRSTMPTSIETWSSFRRTNKPCFPTGCSAALTSRKTPALSSYTRRRSKWNAAHETISRSWRVSCRRDSKASSAKSWRPRKKSTSPCSRPSSSRSAKVGRTPSSARDPLVALLGLPRHYRPRRSVTMFPFQENHTRNDCRYCF